LLIVLAALLTAVATPDARTIKTSDARAVCLIMHARSKHLGETITFVGKYQTDFIERSLIVPNGCDRGVGLGTVAPDADHLLDQATDPLKPDRRIDATFTGTLVQDKPNGLTFHNDDGVRINVSKVTDLKVTDLPKR
jgi:hypothetical protein